MLMAALAFVGYLMFTPHGAKTSIRLISDLSPYDIEYSNLAGTFAGQLTFYDFKLTGPQIKTTAEKIGYPRLQFLRG